MNYEQFRARRHVTIIFNLILTLFIIWMCRRMYVLEKLYINDHLYELWLTQPLSNIFANVTKNRKFDQKIVT
jgi:hypothetical protein